MVCQSGKKPGPMGNHARRPESTRFPTHILHDCETTFQMSTLVPHRFLRYRLSSTTHPLIGLVNAEETSVTAILNVSTGLPYSELYDIIEEYPDLDATHQFELVEDSKRNLSDVEKLAPFSGRDILCIGKNCEHHTLFWLKKRKG